ncbi:hypothetical protein SADUNF_Sadunf09G0029200 [Salix dunnii]|uniref:Uncharacterized protein n=1 Tax=Salix dunnii TaxID=1413687 RepID=A0A835JQ96_9ROSI|nr:hypothetical protein SADUNF_Sadunf09G0029200 [Salix dunnii]
MDSSKQGACSSSSSSSSFTANLFGTTESAPVSSAGVFASMFPPPSTVLGRKSSGSEVTGSWQKQSYGNQTRNPKQGSPDRLLLPDNALELVMCLLVHLEFSSILSRKMREKMILTAATLTVLPEEIGGKVRFIIRIVLPLANEFSTYFLRNSGGLCNNYERNVCIFKNRYLVNCDEAMWSLICLWLRLIEQLQCLGIVTETFGIAAGFLDVLKVCFSYCFLLKDLSSSLPERFKPTSEYEPASP